MSKEGKFAIFCLEQYRFAKGLTGKTAFELFKSSGVLEYVIEFYGALHTVGSNYLIEDIDEFLAMRS